MTREVRPVSESPNTDTTLRAEGFSPPTTKGTEPSPESCSGLFSCGGTTEADYGGGWGSLWSNTPTGVCLSRLACDWKRRRMTFFGRECPWNRDLSRWCQTEGPVLALTSNRAFPGWSVTSAAVCIGTVLNVMLLCWDVRGLRSTGLSCCFSAPRCWTAHTAEAAAQHTQHFALYTYCITPCIYQWHTTCNKAFVKAVVHYTTLCITDFLARWRPVYKHENTLYIM